MGCRKRGPRSDLIRLVLDLAPTSGDTHRVVVDERKCLPGRGAWVHPNPMCVDYAIRRKALPRALRVEGLLDVASLTDLKAGHNDMGTK
ncbi:MAG: YlxR family protein [Cellulomonadaceae bacterium]|nr:YlxR family protein [Cellulomonadaceae bacterium]